MTALAPCPSCSRHVRITDAKCPFCRTALSLESTAPRAMPTQRLGRAATFAFGAAMATGALGCGTQTTPNNVDAGSDAYIGSLDAAYGGPPLDAGTDSGLVAAYGGPPVDAGVDSGPSADAGEDSGNIALYGAPPPPPEPSP